MAKDNVNHPRHYNHGDIECIDAMIAAYGAYDVATFCKVNAFKYLWRCDFKGNTTEDLKKAKWYIEKAIEIRENAKENTPQPIVIE